MHFNMAIEEGEDANQRQCQYLSWQLGRLLGV